MQCNGTKSNHQNKKNFNVDIKIIIALPKNIDMNEFPEGCPTGQLPTGYALHASKVEIILFS